MLGRIKYNCSIFIIVTAFLVTVVGVDTSNGDSASDFYLAGLNQNYSNIYFSWAIYNGMYALYLDANDMDGYSNTYYAYLYMTYSRDYAQAAYNYTVSGYNQSPNSTTQAAMDFTYQDYLYKDSSASDLAMVYAGSDSHIYSAIVNAYTADYYNGLAALYSGLCNRY